MSEFVVLALLLAVWGLHRKLRGCRRQLKRMTWQYEDLDQVLYEERHPEFSREQTINAVYAPQELLAVALTPKETKV